MNSHLPTTRRAAREYLKRRLESAYPQYDPEEIEAIEISILSYIGGGIEDGWQLALVREKDGSIDIKTISLIEKAITVFLSGGEPS